jgi:hypothetical protein
MSGVDTYQILITKEGRAYGHCLELRGDLIFSRSKTWSLSAILLRQRSGKDHVVVVG